MINDGDDFLNGQIILINKPINWTSFQVVKKVRFLIKKKYKLKKLKVGHCGSLDPLATGLLILCTGRLTKKISEINKKYETSHITKDLIYKASRTFIGEISQYPPAFSALKKDGERMYEKARRGEKFVIESRKIKIFNFDILCINNLTIDFEITCSKGTYIRSIAHDLGAKLNSGGYLSSLKRISVGNYNLSDSICVEDFEKQLFK